MKKLQEEIKPYRDMLFQILPYTFVFLASLYLPNDPDLGWHLKYGEYLFHHHKILTHNIFSSMMPQYYWPDGSWLTDLIMYGTFTTSGFFGLSILSAGIVTITFFFFAKAARLTTLQSSFFFPVLTFLAIPVNMSAMRPQQVSLLLLGILFFLLSRYKDSVRLLVFIPLLFLFWANMHQEFVLGLGVLTMWITGLLGQAVLVKKFNPSNTTFLLKLLVLAVIATGITPYGFGLYLIAFAHIGDPLLTKVSEYIPFVPYSMWWWQQVGITFLLVLQITYLAVQKQLLKALPFLLISLVLVFLSFFVQRYIWPGYYTLFLLIPFLPKLKLSSQLSFHLSFLFLLSALCFVLLQKYPYSQFVSLSWGTYCTIQKVPCSPQAAAFLQKHTRGKQIYSLYDWGGWMIWNYPLVKPSIDGRMHLWKDKTGYSAAKEYDIYEHGQKDIMKSPFTVFFIPNQRSPLYLQLSELVSQKKMSILYEDATALIIEKRSLPKQ